MVTFGRLYHSEVLAQPTSFVLVGYLCLHK